MAHAIAELRKLRVSDSQIMRLIRTHGIDRIERQLAWMPYRSYRKASSLIVAAIDQDYEEPANLLDAKHADLTDDTESINLTISD